MDLARTPLWHAAGRLLLAALVAAGAASAQAQSTGGFTVSAMVLSKSNCRFTTPTATLNFNAINPTLPGPATATTSLVVRCGGSAPTATFVITVGDGSHSTGPGARRMRHQTTTTEYLKYAMTPSVTSATVPKNTDYTININGSVLAADYQNAMAGGYSDTVAITVSP